MNKNQARMRAIDPAVSAFLTQDNFPTINIGLKTERQLEKIKKDKLRSKITIDIPEKLKSSLKNLAENHKTTSSQIATLLLIIGLKAVIEEKIDLSRFKTFCRSPRYDWKIRLPNIPHIPLEKKPIDELVEYEIDPIDIEIRVDASVNVSAFSSEDASENA
jgi:hypothetical protein